MRRTLGDLTTCVKHRFRGYSSVICVKHHILCVMTAAPLGNTAANAGTPAPWIPDDSSFGARLALVRQRMAWGNVKEAAIACAVPVESWRTWERDNVQPRNFTVIARRIAERTGCDYGWLVDGQRLAGRPAISLTLERMPERATPERVAATRPGPVRPRDTRPFGRPLPPAQDDDRCPPRTHPPSPRVTPRVQPVDRPLRGATLPDAA
jgi:hypothetical protein